jgi:hypothetical protein
MPPDVKCRLQSWTFVKREAAEEVAETCVTCFEHKRYMPVRIHKS